tara:strand:+ start:1297 stop:1695 length:399 start_codon:yes stop_codon:yes gene_type:complete
MKTIKKNDLSDVGIRLKIKKSNILENFSRNIRKRKKSKKRKKEKKKKISKKIKIEKKIDPLQKIADEVDESESLEILEVKKEKKMEEKVEKKDIKLKKGKKDISEDDPLIKKITVDDISEEKNKVGSGIIIS